MTICDNEARILGVITDLLGSANVSDSRTVLSALGKLDSLLLEEVCDCICFGPSTNGGTGVFAVKDIPGATSIIIDKPSVSVLDVDVAKSSYGNMHGSDSIALVNEIAVRFNESIAQCLRSLYPIRGSSSPSPIDESFPHDVFERLRQALPSDIHPNDVVRAVQLNSLGFYTFPELCTYNEHLRFLTGTGLYPRGSMFNHSCEPSVNHYSVGDVTIFRTLRDVREGEELFISYIGSDLLCESTSVRREFLDSRDFTCSCTKCSRPDDEEDLWVEELELADRISIRLLPSPQSRVALIRRLLNEREFIHKDVISLKFQLCRELGSDGIADWMNLVDSVKSSADFSAVVILVHCMVWNGFDKSITDRIRHIAVKYLGPTMGSLGWIGNLFRVTDFASEVDRGRFDKVWSDALAS